MKYTRENIDNETLFILRGKVRKEQHAARDLVEHIDAWLQERDTASLDIVLARLNSDAAAK